MRPTKPLILGILACLVLGTLVATAQTSVEVEPDDSPMTVPSGAVGDKILYARFERTGPDKGWQPLDAHGLHVEAKSTAPDKTGLVHDVIRVLDLDVPRGREQAQAMMTSRYHVDLATREVIRWDFGAGATSAEGVASQGAFTFSNFGPDIFGPDVPFQFDAFEHQGKTYTLGQDLMTPELELTLRAPSEFDWEEFQAEYTVAERARINGTDVYGIRVHVHGVGRGNLSDEGSEQEGWTERLTLDRVQTQWVSAEHPYALLIETTMTIESAESGATTHEELQVLNQLQTGTTPIPWGQDRATEHYPETNKGAERSAADARYPQEGTGSSLNYTQSAALAAIESDLRLLNYRLWRQSHPTAQIVGFDYVEGSGTAGSTVSTWSFTWAQPDGQGYTVSSQQQSNLPVVQNQEVGETDLEPFKPEDLPTAPITLGEAERFWTNIASDEYKEFGPNSVRWGARIDGVTVQAQQIEFGYERTVVSFTSADLRNAMLHVRADTGNLEQYSELQFRFDTPGFGLRPTTDEPAPIQPSAAAQTFDFDVAPPTVDRAALASTSLLAVFLAVYFFPILKYAGGQALFLLPGYAKLRDEAILGNRMREQLMQLIRTDPGIHASDLGRKIDAGWGTVIYHLGVLEKKGLVTTLVDGRHKRFFPVGIIDHSRRGQLGVLRNDRTRSIYQMIAEEPGVIQGEIAQRVGISVPSTIWHLRRLEDSGLVGRDKAGRKVHYYPVEPAPDVPPYDPRDAVEIA